jgi:hypothetical protein
MHNIHVKIFVYEYAAIFIIGKNNFIEHLKFSTTLSSKDKPTFELMGFLLFNLCFHVVCVLIAWLQQQLFKHVVKFLLLNMVKTSQYGRQI